MCNLPHHHHHRIWPLLLLLHTASLPTTISAAAPTPATPLLPSDAVALLKFKSKADIGNKLLYDLNERSNNCQWQGVKCVQGRIVHVVLQGHDLTGIFVGNTLARLDKLRVLSLRNKSLSGTIPDLSTLTNLKTLFLDHNTFSGNFPLSLVSLHRLRSLNLACNNLAGLIPIQLNDLDQLIDLLHLPDPPPKWSHHCSCLVSSRRSTMDGRNMQKSCRIC